jgi:hypothetical protein
MEDEPMTEPRTEAGKGLLRSDFDTTGWGPSVVREHVTKAVFAIEDEAAAHERARLRARLGGDGWVRLPTGTTATVVHVVMDDCECGGLGCSLDPEPEASVKVPSPSIDPGPIKTIHTNEGER